MKLSAQQKRVLKTKGVKCIGIDAKNRPVCEAMVGIPHQLRRWAVLRSGDPTDVIEPVASPNLWPEDR